MPSSENISHGVSRLIGSKHLAPGLFCLGIWGTLLITSSVLILRYGSIIPRADDWALVPGILSHDGCTLHWLWEQTADHRLPLQKLLLWLLWQVRPGDLRLGMLAGFWGLSVCTLVLLLLIWHLRGRAEYSDSYFPVILLTFGHANIFLWWTTTGVSWFVGLAALGSALLICYYDRPTPLVASVTGAIAILLPLLGSSGAIYGCVLALALLAWAFRRELATRVRLISLAFASAVFLLFAAYVLAFDRSGIQSPYVSLSRWVEASLQFLVMGLGIGAKRFWPAAVLLPLGLVVLITLQTIILVVRKRCSWLSAASIVAAFFAPVAVAMAVGWGRQFQGGLIDRYVLYAAPFYCGAYVFWTKFRMPLISWLAHHFLCFFATAGLFWGLSNGLALAKSLQSAQQAFFQDIQDGLPLTAIVARHGEKWGLNESSFAAGIKLLREAAIKPFSRIPDDPPLREILLSTAPAEVRHANFQNGSWICLGRDSELLFKLPAAVHVVAIQCQFVLRSRSAGTTMRVRWQEPNSDACLLAIHEVSIFKGFNTAKPRRLEQQTFWIDRTIDSFAISPSEAECEFELRRLVLLVPDHHQ